MKPQQIIFFLFVSLVVFLCIPTLLNQTQFVDSLTYSTIAKDMAIGKSSFWNCYYLSYNSAFREHPPLAMWLQSGLFTVFKTNHILPHAFFTLIILFSNGLGIKLIWQKLMPKRKKEFYFPLFLWIITPVVFWSFSNNLLENTLSMFIIYSVFFALKAIHIKKNYTYLLISVFCCFCAILTKGPVGIFPLITLPVYWIIYRDKNAFYFSLLFFIGLLFFLFLLTLNENALTFFKEYINTQFLPSINGKREVNEWGHFYIIQKLLIELIPICIIIIIAFIAKKIEWKKNKKVFTLLFFLGIFASLPLSISPKSHGFYIVPSIVFFALAATSIIKINYNSIILKCKNYSLLISSITILIFASSILYTTSKYNNIGHDKSKIEFAKKTRGLLPTSINQIEIDRSLEYNFVLRGYLARYFNIRAETHSNKLKYKITTLNYKETEVLLQKNGFKLIKKSNKL